MGALAVTRTSVRTVLVVDDEEVVRMVLRRFFDRRGWAVLEADSAERGLEVIDTHALPDLVVCDLHLPGLSGTDLCRQATERHPALASRLVLTSGDPYGASAELERASLHCRVLGKPFTIGDLDRLVETMSSAA